MICHVDPVRIEQVVWNLLGNAVKFTSDNGRITVTLSAEQTEAKLTVTDTGIGIAPEHLPQIFDLFNQGPATEKSGSRAGLGVGLALVKELLNAQGGRIEAQSPGAGRGSTFSAWIPLAESPVSVPARVAPLSRLTGLRILMVDDHKDSLEIFAMVLELEGAIVSTATSGSTALEMLRADDYDLLLSDIGMPEMSGLDLMRSARELRPGKRFRSVAVTGFGSASDARDALAAGFDAHISKPVSLDRLRSVLQRL